MKFRHAFIFIPCLIVSLGSAVTPGLAVTHITSADTLTISLGALPPATYATAGVQLNFTDFGSNTGPDVLDAGEGFRLNLFNSGNSLVSQVSFTSLSGGLAVSVGTVGPVGNTGHFFIDQIVGSFDLYSVIISGFITNQIFPGERHNVIHCRHCDATSRRTPALCVRHWCNRITRPSPEAKSVGAVALTFGRLSFLS